MRKFVMVFSLVILGMAATTRADIFTATFQQGVNGYMGTRSALLQDEARDVNFIGGENYRLSVDADGLQHSLLGFGDVFGDGPSQIPVGSIIHSATLRVFIRSAGSGWNWHRMVSDWDQSSVTWNSIGGGIKADDSVAATFPTLSAGANNDEQNIQGEGWPSDPSRGYLSVGDLTADLQAWANGAPNYGWGILPFVPYGTDGIDFFSHTYPDGGLSPYPRGEEAAFARPLLTVDYSPVPEPHSIALLLTGAVLLGGTLRWRNRKRA